MRHLLTFVLLWGLVAARPDAAEQLAPAKPEVLFRQERAWPDYSRPLAALRLAQPPSALHYVPGWRDGSAPRFLAVGDAAGGLLLLSPGGQVLAQHATGTGSPVTAASSYRMGHNATVLLSGHASGELRLHLLQHPFAPIAGSQPGWEDAEDEWEQAAAAAATGTGSGMALQLSLQEVLPAEALLCGCAAGQAAGTCAATDGAAAAGAAEAVAASTTAESQPSCPPIAAVHGSGRGGNVASTVVVVDAAGALAVLKHGGPSNSGVRIVRRSRLGQQPVALRLPPLASVAALLGRSGLAAQRLGPPPAAAKPGSSPAGQPDKAPGTAQTAEAAAAAAATAPPGWEAGPAFRPCTSLNGSSIVAAAFDAQHGSRAYAADDDGRLLALVVGGGDRGAPAGCVVRAAAPLPAALLQAAADGAFASGGGSDGGTEHSSKRTSSSTGPLLSGAISLATIPGYLLVTAGDRLAVFNVSSGPRHAPRLLLQQPLAPLLSRFTSSGGDQEQSRTSGQADQAAGAAEHAKQEGWTAPPLLAAGQTHVALTLGSRVLAMFDTSLPYRPPPQPYRASLAWMQLFQPAAMILVAAFVLHRARSKRGGGGGGGGGGRGGGAGFGGDARLREFERLLQDPMAGATAPRRQRPSWLRGGRAGGSSDSSGSDVEDSLLGTLPRDATHAEPAAHCRGGLFGPRPASSNGAASGKRAQQAQRQRAAALAMADDADIRALRAELAGSGLGGGAELAGDPAEVDMADPAPTEVGDEVSVLRRRLNQAHI
ncbi:hypothetical protein ABPG75_003365 [Micractinium tetrahymenae]